MFKEQCFNFFFGCFQISVKEENPNELVSLGQELAAVFLFYFIDIIVAN